MHGVKRVGGAAKAPRRAGRRRAGLATGVMVAAGALLGAAVAPAQAYSPNPSVSITQRDTGNCPCSLSDPFDGTYFAHDPGGVAVKAELYEDGWYVGKVEWHPNGEKLWIYDTKNDGDSFYVQVAEIDTDGHEHDFGTYSAPGTDNVVDTRVVDMSFPESVQLTFWIYDDKGRTDLIASPWGVS